MQVGTLPIIIHLDLISSLILRTADMHGLVKIAYEMNDELQGDDLLILRSLGISKLCLALLQGAVDILLGHAFYLLYEIGVAKSQGQIDIVPGAGILVFGLRTDLIG